ncbi:MAG: cation transporter [Candidatus Roizmanbacteria bacterium]|nr:MAG: cation transporter [Candidatus Roizmanbacteria bacterium]
MRKEEQQKQISNSALKWSALSALIASLCCIGPLVLVLFGIGGASTALAIGYRKPYFLLFGLAVLIIGLVFIYRKSCSTTKLSRKQQVFIFGGSFLVAALLYYFLTYVGVPAVTPLVYQSSSASNILASFSNNRPNKATLKIEGMSCASCAVSAQYSLKSLPGVADAYIGLTKNLDGEGWIVYEPDQVTKEQIIKAIEPYKATFTSDSVYTQ